MPVFLIGLSHHTAPIAVREQFSISEHALPRALASLASLPCIREVALLSTCNRMEIYAITDEHDLSSVHPRIVQHLAENHNIPDKLFTPHLYSRHGEEAVTHLMRVSSGLDSLVLGEAQILGQVRSALRSAQQHGSIGSTLTTLFQSSLSTGKRVQSETELGRGAFSIGHAAVDLARSIFADLANASVLILGAGKMSELTAKHLVESGVRFVIVANRTYSRAEAMAAQLNGKAIHYDRFPEALATADIVISSTAAPHPILRRDNILPAIKQRRGRPLFLIDIAVPRDIDQDVSRLENVFLKNIDDLQDIVAESAAERRGEVIRAEKIVSEETARFVSWYRSREAAPVIAQLQQRLENIRQDDLSLLKSRLSHLSEKEWEAIEITTRAMMRKVIREPILRLKREAEMGESAKRQQDVNYDLFSAVREIFDLEMEGETLPLQEEPLANPPLNETSIVDSEKSVHVSTRPVIHTSEVSG